MRFGKLLARVAQGEEVIITSHDRPVARIIPEGDNRASERAAMADLRELHAKILARKDRPEITLRDVRSAIAEGRR
jgi:prevent-host-death family protein